ncbi:hypothetical protein ACFYY3_33210 [Streptomyces sp. NPDC001812]|uniref:hypothetical protein n=1 Tax=Streptomyces sp. NPDC001812 TaxID=3364611 RepID=UPI0036C2FFB4
MLDTAGPGLPFTGGDPDPAHFCEVKIRSHGRHETPPEIVSQQAVAEHSPEALQECAGSGRMKGMSSAPDEKPLKVGVSDAVPLEGGPEGALAVTATVVDPNHPKRQAVFEYIAVPNHRLAPVSVTVRPAPDLPFGEYVAAWPSEVRDLPLSQWETSARLLAEVMLGHDVFRDAGEFEPGQGRTAEEWVLERYPELLGDNSPAGRRRLRSLTHLADVALDYARRSIYGAKDPAAAIARSRDANPATVRSWIHRARKAGFLPETQQGGKE